MEGIPQGVAEARSKYWDGYNAIREELFVLRGDFMPDDIGATQQSRQLRTDADKAIKDANKFVDE